MSFPIFLTALFSFIFVMCSEELDEYHDLPTDDYQDDGPDTSHRIGKTFKMEVLDC